MKKIMIELIVVIIGVFVFAVETSLPDGSVYYGSLKGGSVFRQGGSNMAKWR